VQVWYPADTAAKPEKAEYIPSPALLRSMEKDGYYDLDASVIGSWKGVETHSVLDAPLLKGSSSFPLLIFSHGLGVSRSHYTAILEDLASHGYIVASIDHPYGGITALPDGRVLTTKEDPSEDIPAMTVARVEMWAADASFVLDRFLDQNNKSTGRFASRIDRDRVGMLGHSLGGAAALEAGLRDRRFKACADLDGAPFGKVIKEGPGCPTLVLRSKPIYSDEDLAKRGRTREQWEQIGREVRTNFISVLQKNKNFLSYMVVINGTGHMSFSDAPFVMPQLITSFGGSIIEPKRGFEIMMAYTRAFFEKHLDGKRNTLLDSTSKLYPEVSVEKLNQATALEKNNNWDFSVQENLKLEGTGKSEYRRLKFQSKTGPYKDFTAHVVLLQPDTYKVELIDNPSIKPDTYKSVAGLTKDKGAIAGINGGFFTKEFTPNGLFILKGKVLSPIKKLKSPVLAGLMLIDENGKVELESINSYSELEKKGYYYGLQSGPFLIEPDNDISKAVLSNGMIANQVVKHTVLALSTDNQLLVISTSSVSLKNLADCLSRYPAAFGVDRIKSALSLDGGRSSAFSVRLPDKAVNIEEGWPVRNSVLFFSK
jgi:pimeloyl-ACP methyl ester carboxylesterase/uncharacterized protein YigE (DUF2233 family)